MKKIILISLFILSVVSCQQNKTATVTATGDLAAQKQAIEKQIDSLHKILADINRRLGEQQEQEIPFIDAHTAGKSPFDHYIELQGNIDTDGNVMVVPEAMGSVKKIYKNEGDHVRRGEVLMLIDDALIRNQINEVNTQYELAKTAFERQKRLWDQKIGSEMAFLQAKTRKQSLERKLVTLRSQLDKFKIKAPVSGTLDDLMIKRGEMAAPQRPVARIVNLSQVYMQADVSEKYLPVIKKGTPVIIEFPELDKTLNASISYTGNFIHPNNRTFKIRINLSNKDGSLKPNLTGDIKIKDFHTDKAVVLPLSLIQEDRQGNNFVFLLKEIKDKPGTYQVVKQIVQTGVQYKGKAVITSGLKEGDQIAGEASRGLTEGDKVKIRTPENKES